MTERPRFWVVRIGTGPVYGPFTARQAEWFAASRGMPTSNFIMPVLPPPDGQMELFSGGAS